MKKIIKPVIAVFILASMAFSISEPLPIGSDLPMATEKLKDISGKKISMKDVVKDKGLLVIFSCNTCPYVIKNESRIIEICNYAKEMNIGVIVLNSNEAYRSGDDSFDAMKKYAAEQKFEWYYAVDKKSEIADAFGAKRTPECFLFDKSLKLAYHGAIDDNPADEMAVTKNYLKEAINSLKAGLEIVTQKTKSVGCAIKRIK